MLNEAQSHVNGQLDVWERMGITHGAKEGKLALGGARDSDSSEFIQGGMAVGVSKTGVKGASGGAAEFPEKGEPFVLLFPRINDCRGRHKGQCGVQPLLGSCSQSSSSAIFRGGIVAGAFKTQEVRAEERVFGMLPVLHMCYAGKLCLKELSPQAAWTKRISRPLSSPLAKLDLSLLLRSFGCVV